MTSRPTFAPLRTAPAPAAAQNLVRVLAIRLAVLTILGAGLWFAHARLGLPVPLTPIGLILGFALMVTGAVWWRVRGGRAAPAHGAIAVQLLVDVAILTGIAYFTGGWTNPLVSLYLVPIAAAAALLPARWTAAITAAAVLAYTVLTRYYQPILDLHHGGTDFALHVTGMWLTFVLAALLLAYFGTRFAAALRQSEQALGEAREANLRNEQIMGIATLAAGTAHELSTPLATIAVIAAELGDPAAPVTRSDIDELSRQVGICREILTRLRAAAEPATQYQSPTTFLGDVAERFTLLRPEVRLLRNLQGCADPAALAVDPMLRQAVLNLLDNAANVSPDGIGLAARIRQNRLEIEIRDGGAGQDDTGGHRGGLGVGLLLANATIERRGGAVFAERAGAGTRVRIELPLATSAGASLAAPGMAS